jgi:imidazoleglycerol-phosphate dehydratase
MNKHLTFRRKHLHTWKNFILTTFERSMVIIMSRNAKVERKTNETDIILELDLDGTGKGMIETGIGFLNHMLDNFTRHGFFDLNLVTNGDLHVDAHHTVEDTGIVLGQAIRNALGDKKGIKRYGNAIIPMDETLVLCALDLSGRPYLVFDLPLTAEKVGYMETELVKRILLCHFLLSRHESSHKINSWL